MVFKPAAVAQKRLPVPTGHNAVLQQGEMYVANGSVSGGAGGQVTGYKKGTAAWLILEIMSNYFLQ